MHKHTILFRLARGMLLVSLILLLPVTQASAIKCWKNDQDIKECGFTVPREYANREIQILNQQGQVIRTIPRARTPQEKIHDAELAKIEKEKQHKIAERRRQDRILLNTFTTENDILISRDKKLEQLDGLITITLGNNITVEKNLRALTSRAANYERNSNPVPEKLIKNINTLKQKIDNNLAYIETQKKDKKEINKKFAKDIKRFRELKKIKPQ